MANDYGLFADLVPSGPGAPKADKVLDKTIDYQDKFLRRPEVSAYRTAVPILRSMATAPAGGGGDLEVVNSISKILDPNSAVMQGESENAMNSQGMFGSIVARARNEVDKEGKLRPETRRALLAAGINRTRSLAEAYNTSRSDAARTAKALSLDPNLIVGTHPGDQLVRSGLANRSGSGMRAAGTRQQPFQVKTDRDYASVPVGAFYFDHDDRKIKQRGR